MAGERGTGKKQNNNKSGAQVRHQQEKRERAEERQSAYAALTIEEKFALLETRPGESKKVRAKLA